MRVTSHSHQLLFYCPLPSFGNFSGPKGKSQNRTDGIHVIEEIFTGLMLFCSSYDVTDWQCQSSETLRAWNGMQSANYYRQRNGERWPHTCHSKSTN